MVIFLKHSWSRDMIANESVVFPAIEHAGGVGPNEKAHRIFRPVATFRITGWFQSRPPNESEQMREREGEWTLTMESGKGRIHELGQTIE
jgi:hypothetical protein